MTSMAEVLKKGCYLAVSRFESSGEQNRYPSNIDTPVMSDMLPHGDEMVRLFEVAGLTIEHFVDETGFYLLLGRTVYGFNRFP